MSSEFQPLSESDLRAARLLAFATSLSAIALTFLVFLVGNLRDVLISPKSGATGAQGSPPPPEKKRDLCAERMPCSAECEANAELRCLDGLWAKPRGIEKCAESDTDDLIVKVKESCGDRSCKAADFKQLVLSDQNFGEIVNRFGSTHIIHFDKGTPPRDFGHWSGTDSPERQHYIFRLRNALRDLRLAETILLIGTASPDRRAHANDDITYRRVGVAQDFVTRITEDVDILDDLSDKLRLVQLGDARQISASEYAELLKNNGTMIAWSDEAEARLSRAIEAGDDLSAAERDFRDNTINQAVFVIPIPCKTDAAKEEK